MLGYRWRKLLPLKIPAPVIADSTGGVNTVARAKLEHILQWNNGKFSHRGQGAFNQGTGQIFVATPQVLGDFSALGLRQGLKPAEAGVVTLGSP